MGRLILQDFFVEAQICTEPVFLARQRWLRLDRQR
jgi:hypothetical protein